MTQLTLLERKRKAFIHAKLDTLQKKHSSHSVIVKVAEINYRLDLDEDVLNIALISLFEKNVILSLKGKLIAEDALVNSYDSFYTKNGDLTAEGNEFMKELLKIIAQKMELMK
ncbi:hypothetical protein XBJ2_2030008 [Xenorhabdus bovienii str. Jollieti]|uniref:Uncharacterized protein n=1 Tax=Xenorhabdus bovienii (strain SS-2004) TaxID=406818 RepID=D3V619_XENBS|nr:hypothetical protein [Xenorhabdus bovienii]CBJ83098.1 hypothetical protein XBJ1_3980 [Xenorhabdus bovienii SS-2004]CDH28825.1 hypothetical protein XBJ2_2030008 [Xenorhabdus bovienii str. Jollieti]